MELIKLEIFFLQKLFKKIGYDVIYKRGWNSRTTFKKI